MRNKSNSFGSQLLRLVFTLAIVSTAVSVQAQDGTLYQPADQGASGQTLQNSSFLFRELPPEAQPRELQKHDIIVVLVDISTRFSSEGDAESRKTASLTAALADWIKLDGGSLKPATQADGDPTISASLNSQFKAEADVELRDSLSFRMAAEIVEIRPNGNLVIEAHQTIRNNEEKWKTSFTGVVRREAIQADRTVSSHSILHFEVHKEESGQVRDGYSRGWLSKWYDRFKPI